MPDQQSPRKLKHVHLLQQAACDSGIAADCFAPPRSGKVAPVQAFVDVNARTAVHLCPPCQKQLRETGQAEFTE